MNFFHDVLGTTPGVFLGITLVFMGGCAFMAGQALASTWRPIWQAIPYALLMACADRFLTFALFKGQLLSGPGYVVDAAILMVIALSAYRARRARQMVVQYPWLYERAGLFGWRERIHQEP